MGLGDDLMVTGIAKIEKEKFPDRQIVIGNFHKKLVYHSIIYDNNPNITNPRKIDSTKPIHYIDYHSKNRPYVDRQKSTKDNWVWNFNFRPIPGEIYFSLEEKKESIKIIKDATRYWKKNNTDIFKGIIFIEPSSAKPKDKLIYIKNKNKDWSFANWLELTEQLNKEYLIIQSIHKNSIKLPGVYYCEQDFRLACSVLNNTDLYVGVEGGFGHAAAALNKKAVIYFGGWIHPNITGYSFHQNIYVNIEGSPCGAMTYECSHCVKCKKKITVDFVHNKIIREISKKLEK